MDALSSTDIVPGRRKRKMSAVPTTKPNTSTTVATATSSDDKKTAPPSVCPVAVSFLPCNPAAKYDTVHPVVILCANPTVCAVVILSADPSLPLSVTPKLSVEMAEHKTITDIFWKEETEFLELRLKVKGNEKGQEPLL